MRVQHKNAGQVVLLINVLSKFVFFFRISFFRNDRFFFFFSFEFRSFENSSQIRLGYVRGRGRLCQGSGKVMLGQGRYFRSGQNVRLGQVRSGKVRLGKVRYFRLGQNCQAGIGVSLVRLGVRLSQAWLGQVRVGRLGYFRRSGQVRLVRIGQVRLKSWVF